MTVWWNSHFSILAYNAHGWWQAGLWIWSEAGDILLHEADSESQIVVHQHLLHESSEILPGTIPWEAYLGPDSEFGTPNHKSLWCDPTGNGRPAPGRAAGQLVGPWQGEKMSNVNCIVWFSCYVMWYRGSWRRGIILGSRLSLSPLALECYRSNPL